jgi:hypothetical protein
MRLVSIEVSSRRVRHPRADRGQHGLAGAAASSTACPMPPGPDRVESRRQRPMRPRACRRAWPAAKPRARAPSKPSQAVRIARLIASSRPRPGAGTFPRDYPGKLFEECSCRDSTESKRRISMAKPNLKLVVPTPVNGTVPPRRRSNAELTLPRAPHRSRDRAPDEGCRRQPPRSPGPHHAVAGLPPRAARCRTGSAAIAGFPVAACAGIRSSTPVSGWVEGEPFLARFTCSLA